MNGLETSVPTDDQPIGGHGGSATLLGESKWLTEWITPNALDIQATYRALTEGLRTRGERVMEILGFIADYRYTRFVKVAGSVAGKRFVQYDAWLEPASALRAPALNCANRSFALTSLLRCELSSEEVFCVLGNLHMEGQGGHAWVMVRNGHDYILESTSPRVRSRPIRIEDAEPYEAVVFFNDAGVRMVPGVEVLEPFSACFCVPWLEDYLDKRACSNL